MTDSFVARLLREWRFLAADPWLASLVSWIPLLLFGSIWFIFSGGIARDLACGVVDLDDSRISRGLIRQYDASPALSVARAYRTTAEGARALRDGEIYALVILPASLEKDALRGRTPQVTAFYNSQFILIGRLLNAALQQSHGTSVAGIEVVGNLLSGSSTPNGAQAAAVPLVNQTNPLFNSSSNYAQFLVSAIVPAIWQVLIVVTTVLSLASELRRDGLARWLGPRPAAALLAKMLPFSFLFWLQGATYLWGMFVLLDWPMHGSWKVLLAAQLLTVLACQAAGACIFLLSRDPVRALSLAAAYTAPAFAFMGITFPVTDMNLAARIWRSLLPIGYYIDIQVSQANYGLPLTTVMPEFCKLAVFLLLFAAVLRLARRISKAPVAEEITV